MNHIVNHLNRMVDNFERAVMNYRPMLGGKILYRESDIQKILMANYREAYRMKGL